MACNQDIFNKQDFNAIKKNCQKCDGCPTGYTTLGGVPVLVLDKQNNSNHCIIWESKCPEYFNYSTNKKANGKEGDTTQVATKNQAVDNKAASNAGKGNTNANANKNTNNNANKGNGNANNTGKSAASTPKTNTTNNDVKNNPVTTTTTGNNGTSNTKVDTKGMINTSKPADSITNQSDSGSTFVEDNTSNNDAEVENANEEVTVGNGPNLEIPTESGSDGDTVNISNTDNAYNASIGSGNGNDNSVSPILIGSLSIFTIFFILVGFVYIRKRKHDKEEDLDLIYRNSIFYATPIVEKNLSQNSSRSNKSNKSNKSNGSSGSNGSKCNLQGNQTAISSNDDGVYDIIISPTAAATAATAATVNKSQTVQSGKSLGTQLNEESSVMPMNNSLVEADEGVFSEEESLLRHHPSVNNSYNQLNRIDSARVTEAIASAYMSPEIITTPLSKNTSISNRSLEERVTPLPPAAVHSPKVAVQNAHLVYETNDISVHEPNLSFVNSTNNISFINNNVKEDSYMISNYYEANNENSINQDSKLMYSPSFNTSTIKKSLSMVLSEYKEDSFYNAKFNYEPSMEDEMRISINDRVLVKEIFNDGWAYGENKTTETCGIFPINRLDSTTSN